MVEGEFEKAIVQRAEDVTDWESQFLRDYFYAGGEGPIPLETLQNQKYRDVMSIRLYYDWHTYVFPARLNVRDVRPAHHIHLIHSDALMEECVRMMQQTLRAAPSVKKRAKSVYSQRNLGTIKDRKREKKQQEKEIDNGEIIMRILRMRYVSRFLTWCTLLSGLFTHDDIIADLERQTSLLNKFRSCRQCKLSRSSVNARRRTASSRGLVARHKFRMCPLCQRSLLHRLC